MISKAGQNTAVRSTRRGRTETSGLTLVETAVLVSLVGVLLAVFVPTFVAKLRTSKVQEASDMLETIHAATTAYYEARHERQQRCLPPSSEPTPSEPSAELVDVDFGAEPWVSLGVTTEDGLRYSYQLIVPSAGCDLRVPTGRALFTVRAVGDLDDDGVRSTFERSATLDENGTVVPLGVLYVTRRVE